MAIDTSLLVELVRGGELGRRVRDILAEPAVQAATTELNIAELSYMICRKAGWERSAHVVRQLRDSGTVAVIPITGLLDRASRMKCERSISLPDCFVISLGESTTTPILFVKHETELDREMRRSPFKSPILFLEDLT